MTIERRMMVKIRKETLKDGRVVWRARGVSTGKDPVTGRRTQRTITCSTKKAVEAEMRRIGHAVDRGTYVRPWDGAVPELIDSYLVNGADQWEANTQLSYANALQPAREWFAHSRARAVQREDVEEFKQHLQASGRRRGGTPGTGLSPRSVNLTLGQLQAAFELAERDGKVARNPVRFVKRVKPGEREHASWSEEQLLRFIGAAAADRLYACWLLSLLGLRRAEVLGERWSGVNLLAGAITITRTRVLVNGQVIEKGPKSRRSARTLPLFEPVTGALEALYTLQQAEKDKAGPAYAADVDAGYVCADELGEPLHPERYSDEFARLCRQACVPVIRLHDTRATVNSLLEKLGVSDSLRAAWLGHTIAVNRSAYLGAPRPEELAVISTAPGKIFRPM